MSYTSLERAEIEEKILQEIKKTEMTVKDLKELTAPIAPDCAIGRVSRMDAIQNKSINEATLRKAENKLKGLNVSLQNIDDADFGKCARCRNEIPVQRLLLLPQSKFCVHCSGKY